MDAAFFDPADLFQAVDAAFAHGRNAARDERRQTLGGRKVHLECLQVTVVDPDDLRAGFHGRSQFFFRMHFDDGIQAQRARLRA